MRKLILISILTALVFVPSLSYSAGYSRVTLPIQCGVPNSDQLTYVFVAGGHPSTSTILCNGSIQNITVDGSSKINFSLGSGGSTWRYRFLTGVNSTPVITISHNSCSFGTCHTFAFLAYFQVELIFSTSPANGTVFANNQQVSGPIWFNGNMVIPIAALPPPGYSTFTGWTTNNTGLPFYPFDASHDQTNIITYGGGTLVANFA